MSVVMLPSRLRTLVWFSGLFPVSVLKVVHNTNLFLQVAGAFVACHGLPTLSLFLSFFLSFSLSLSLSIDPEIGILRRHFYELLGRS